MTLYSYPQSKVIDEVIFKKTEQGAVRAYLHVKPDTDLATVKSVIDALKEKKYDCVPFTLGDKQTLEVRGFKDEKKLLSTLFTHQWIVNKPIISEQEGDEVSWKDWLSKRTLQLSGASYLIGDAGFFYNGVKGKDKWVVAGSFSYFLGTLALIFYGRNDQSDLQVHDLAKNLEKLLQQEKIKIPEDSAIHAIAEEKQKGFLQTLDEFARKNPSEIFNTVTGIAGLFVATSAFKKFKGAHTAIDAKAINQTKLIGGMDMMLGGVTATAGAFGTLVKEKKYDPDAPKKTGLAWLWEKVQEHPLAVTGGGYSFATLCHAASTVVEYRDQKRRGEKPDSVYGRGLFVGAALLSEFLLAISSKGHGEGVVIDSSVDTSIVAIASEVIARQPVEEQEKLIIQMGSFLGKQEALAMEDAEVTLELRKHVQLLRDNPWAKCCVVEKAVPVEAPPGTATIAAPETAPPLWQDKLAARDAAMPQVHMV